MKIDFHEVYVLLRQEPILTYKMLHRLFHSPLDSRLKLWFGDGAAMLLDHSLHMYGEEKALDRFLAQLESGREYSFFGVPCKYLPLLNGHFQGIQCEEQTSAYTITASDFVGQPAEPLDSLTLADAEFVNEHWTYKHEGSLDFFKHIIATYPSSAVRIDGQLAGWAVCYDAIEDMVNLGSLRVLEQYRRQGLGSKLARDLVAKVLATGKTPMVHILDDNIASRTLSMEIGFTPYRERIFWGRGVKK
jgi:GNAT superfamily N-acetyltransferase